MLAYEKGLYVVWRCLPERVGGAYMQSCTNAVVRGDSPRTHTHGAASMLSGSNDDFCTRVGYRSRCFCGHNLADHSIPDPASMRGGSSEGSQGTSCESTGCGCQRYRYVPNCPEEIGEGWLSRRRDWDPRKWSAKCRCGHGAFSHDPARLTCRECRSCAGFASHFLCVVCDQPWEAHVTVFEGEAARRSAGRAVREDYFPLSGIDWDVRALVLKDPTGGGALEAPPPGNRIGARNAVKASGRKAIAGPSAGSGSDPNPPVEVIDDDLPEYCAGCATIFRSPQSKFCTKCGRPRRCQ